MTADTIIEMFFEQKPSYGSPLCIVQVSPNRWQIGMLISQSEGMAFGLDHGDYSEAKAYGPKFDWKMKQEIVSKLFPQPVSV